jgi:hypothetical protein
LWFCAWSFPPSLWLCISSKCLQSNVTYFDGVCDEIQSVLYLLWFCCFTSIKRIKWMCNGEIDSLGSLVSSPQEINIPE